MLETEAVNSENELHFCISIKVVQIEMKGMNSCNVAMRHFCNCFVFHYSSSDLLSCSKLICYVIKTSMLHLGAQKSTPTGNGISTIHSIYMPCHFIFLGFLWNSLVSKRTSCHLKVTLKGCQQMGSMYSFY